MAPAASKSRVTTNAGTCDRGAAHVAVQEVIEGPRRDDGHGKLIRKLSPESTLHTVVEAPIGVRSCHHVAGHVLVRPGGGQPTKDIKMGGETAHLPVQGEVSGQARTQGSEEL